MFCVCQHWHSSYTQLTRYIFHWRQCSFVICSTVASTKISCIIAACKQRQYQKRNILQFFGKKKGVTRVKPFVSRLGKSSIASGLYWAASCNGSLTDHRVYCLRVFVICSNTSKEILGSYLKFDFILYSFHVTTY